MLFPTAQTAATAEVSNWLSGVEQLANRVCLQEVPVDASLTRAYQHHLGSGGQRTRARLAFIAGSALNLSSSDSVALSTAVELLHNASLVQDDLQDRCPRRRGCESVWKRFGPDAALGLTDLLLSGAYAALAELSNPLPIPALLRKTHRAVSLTVHGQAADLSSAGGEVESFLQVARQKSGYLFALSLELPLIAAGWEDRLADAGTAACNFGVGYQIYDDLLDVESDRESGLGANVVLALEADHSPTVARGRAFDLAFHHLEYAQRLAQSLPLGSGAGLATLARELVQKIEGLFDE